MGGRGGGGRLGAAKSGGANDALELSWAGDAEVWFVLNEINFIPTHYDPTVN